MKSLKVLLVVATIASANVAMGQEKTATKSATTSPSSKETPEQHAARQTARLTSICGLTADQQAEAKQIFLESDVTIQASNKAAGKDKVKAEADKKKLVEERKKKLDAVLTPDQEKKLDEANKAHKGNAIDSDVK